MGWVAAGVSWTLGDRCRAGACAVKKLRGVTSFFHEAPPPSYVAALVFRVGRHG